MSIVVLGAQGAEHALESVEPLRSTGEQVRDSAEHVPPRAGHSTT